MNNIDPQKGRHLFGGERAQDADLEAIRIKQQGLSKALQQLHLPTRLGCR